LLITPPSLGFYQEGVSTTTRIRHEKQPVAFYPRELVQALAPDRGYVLETGKVILEGEAAELLENAEVKRAYLGKDKKEIWER